MCYVCGAEVPRSLLPTTGPAFWCIFHERFRIVLYEENVAGVYRAVGSACVTQQGTTLSVIPCPFGTESITTWDRAETMQIDEQASSVSRLPSSASIPAGQPDVVDATLIDDDNDDAVVAPSTEDLRTFVAEIDMDYNEDIVTLQAIVAGVYDELDDDDDDDLRVLGDIVKSWD